MWYIFLEWFPLGWKGKIRIYVKLIMFYSLEDLKIDVCLHLFFSCLFLCTTHCKGNLRSHMKRRRERKNRERVIELQILFLLFDWIWCISVLYLLIDSIKCTIGKRKMSNNVHNKQVNNTPSFRSFSITYSPNYIDRLCYISFYWFSISILSTIER